MYGALWTITISPDAHENVHVWQRQPRRRVVVVVFSVWIQILTQYLFHKCNKREL